MLPKPDRLLAFFFVLVIILPAHSTSVLTRIQAVAEPAQLHQAGAELLNEQFSSDVFCNGEWQRTDSTSVTVDTDHGWLHIAADGDYGDYASKPITIKLPIIVETRMRLVSGGEDYTLPALEFLYDQAAMPIGITYNTGLGGWLFGVSPDFTYIHTHGPSAENTWTTVRAVIRETGGELYARYDNEPDFTYVTASTFTLPNPVIQVKLRQHWDAVIDIDYITITNEKSRAAFQNLYLPVISKIYDEPLAPSLMFDEARVRYILADSQLGGVIDYYRQFPDDPNATEAVSRWDAGVRVENIAQFERKIIECKGWQVVYAGTEVTINGMDVILYTPSLDEARVRYILADSQLGGVIDYYRQFPGDPSAAEAVRRWDACFRVENISLFERIIIADKGWQVVYAGTETTIDGMDVILIAEQYPYDEARMRYILADSQLGGVIGYYRQFPCDLSAAEAVLRWDAGARVVNIDQFERKIIAGKGWQVVYAGSEITIDGMDVILTIDP
jgi:hypothetical protein